MHSTPRPPAPSTPAAGGSLAAAVLALLLAGCAATGNAPSHGGPGRNAHPGPQVLFGVLGSDFVGLDPATGAAVRVAAVSGASDVAALTFDPATDTVWGVADATTAPRLITVDRATGAVQSVGRLTLPGLPLTLAEGLAWNPADGRLYAAGGRSKFASDRLFVVDPATGQGTLLAPISGTAQNDADALAVVAGKLYAVDNAGRQGALYALDPATGKATAVGKPFTGEVTDLAFDAGSGRLYGADASARQLVTLSLGNDGVAVLGSTHAAADFGGGLLTALVFVPGSGPLFADGFESGDLSLWTGSTKEP